MAEIRVPTLGESVTEATIGKWFKKPGDAVAVDEPLVELETDKVTIEVPAPAAGTLGDIAAKDGETVAVGALLGSIKEGAGAPAKARRRKTGRRGEARSKARSGTGSRRRRRRSPPPMRRSRPRCARSRPKPASDPAKVEGTGKDGRVTKGDMMAAIERAAAAPTPVAQTGRRRAGARALARRRRLARRAREDDAAAPDHRAAAEGRAEHRRDAHDLQRGRHERDHGTCAPSTRICSRSGTA